MAAFCKIFIISLIFLMQTANMSAQTPVNLKYLEKLYGGIWIDKKTSRCLQISFENDTWATITDWTAKYQDREEGDVYKAFMKDGRLVMPEDRQHRAPYSEITVERNKLIYQTKPIAIDSASDWDRQVFTRR